MTPASATFWRIPELVETVCSDFKPHELSRFASVSRDFYAVPGRMMWRSTHSVYLVRAFSDIEHVSGNPPNAKKTFLRRITPFVQSFTLSLAGGRPLTLPPFFCRRGEKLFPNLRNVRFDFNAPLCPHIPTGLLCDMLHSGVTELSIISRGSQPETLKAQLRQLVSQLPVLSPNLTHLCMIWDPPCRLAKVVEEDPHSFVDWDGVASLRWLDTLEVETLPKPSHHSSDALLPMRNLRTLIVYHTDLTVVPAFIDRASAVNVRCLCARGISDRLRESEYRLFFQTLCTALPDLQMLELLVNRIWFQPRTKTATAFEPLAKHPSVQTLAMPGNTYLMDQGEGEKDRLRRLLPDMTIIFGWRDILTPFNLSFY